MTISFRSHKIELSGIESLKRFRSMSTPSLGALGAAVLQKLHNVKAICGRMSETFPDMQTSETVEFFGFDTRKGLRSSLKFECR